MNKCPDCPLCGHPPVVAFASQAFCGNESCRCLTWNPSRTQAENMADYNEVDLPNLGGTA